MSITGIQGQTLEVTDGRQKPLFQEKLVFLLIEGLTEINAIVWNSNTYSSDDFIVSANHAGEVKLILHYANAKKPASSYAPSASPYMATPDPQVPQYFAPHPPPSSAYPASFTYPSYSFAYPPPHYPPPPITYPPHPYPHYPSPPPSAYPPPPYPPPQPDSTYHAPGPYPGMYPPPPY